MMGKFWKEIARLTDAYRIPIFVTMALLIVVSLAFPCDFWKEVISTFRDPKWLAQSVVFLFAFTIFVSWIGSIGRKDHEARSRAPFEGWTFQLTGIEGMNSTRQPIHWTEAQKFETSDFEYWKFVKSCVSNVCMIKTLDHFAARQHGWLIDEGKSILIDFSKMGEADIIRWQGDDIPQTWKWVDPPVTSPRPKIAVRKTD